jgi:hypothetical protein
MRVRELYSDLVERLAFGNAKMAFIAGPKQVGKTTLARQILREHGSTHYHVWDDPTFKRTWMGNLASLVPRKVGDPPVVVLDELHKAPRWKNRLKALYDLHGDDARFLVTGSARLDLFRRGGDSLLGRYFLFRMHPFTLGEIRGEPASPGSLPDEMKRKQKGSAKTLETLMTHGGFPEPFTRRDSTFTTLWHRTRNQLLVREDLRDLQRTNEISLIETASVMLPGRVGSLFSMKSMAEDLEVSQPTVKRWLEWLTQVYLVYRVTPYHRSISRALKKQPKMYMWDWSQVPEPGPRFENLMAGHLLKAVQTWTDSGLGTFDLHFVRDRDGREVDFLLTWDRRPWMLVEAKTGTRPPSQHLIRFSSSLRPPVTVQVTDRHDVHEWFRVEEGRRGYLMSADAFLRLLP